MIEGNYQKWDRRFMRLACEARSWVKGPDLGVGACLVSPDNRGMSLGYSGLPRGMKDSTQRITETEFKDFHIVHAELNAILNASRSVVGWTMYSTTHPCSHCASAIIQAGVRRVVAPRPTQEQLDTSRWRASWTHARIAFKEAGVIFFEYEEALPCD
ncbi:deoxycytidylate deaminase [Roseobacter phage RDJL Phi 2]|uniref:Deoxycytidylate deaminase n=1 Tax=Roseobacter phage RDJL Phi 2 TaxID=1682380 RepID=A0A0K0PWL2_9CAUD|nr:deoxycytidylate deaminase [Roseobacter phage RDJL Phi 2]AKQ75803.1 deoxycytidylate deaminase [Roseobacter phage RDJL Phi 2]